MASTWIWRGSYDRLERITYPERQEHTSGKRNGMPLHMESWTAVRAGDAVIAWSEAQSIDSGRFAGVWVLNVNGAIAARMLDEEKQRIWRRTGLCGGAPFESERLYLVSIVHLEPVDMQRIDSQGRPLGGKPQLRAEHGDPAGRKGPSKYEIAERATRAAGGGAGLEARAERSDLAVSKNERVERASREAGEGAALEARDVVGQSIGRWPEDPALRRVVRTAVQALYALGLDIGEVEVALGGDGRTSVRAAWPRLRETRLEAVSLRRFAAWYAAARAEAVDRRLLIGADPEFVLVTPSGKVASASRFFGAGVGGAAGADALVVGRRLLFPVAELRPEPADDPGALAANVRRLLLRAAARISDPALRWAAGAMPVPGLSLGGHIHLSGAPLTSRLLRLLDSCAAFPFALIEDPAGRARRPRYGTLGDFRQQPHGGFEYRTLPSWLISPAAAKAAFALALLCAREALTLPYIPALEERYVEAYYTGDRSELAGCLEGVAASISATASYPGLAPFIEPLFDAARRGATWDESSDIRAKWRIPTS